MIMKSARAPYAQHHVGGLQQRHPFLVVKTTSASRPHPGTLGACSAIPSSAPTRVRVEHGTYIRSSRAAIWQLLQDIAPAHRWQQIAVVLATLEAIYGVKYQGLGEQLLTAFQQANKSPTAGDSPINSLESVAQTQKDEAEGLQVSYLAINRSKQQHLNFPGSNGKQEEQQMQHHKRRQRQGPQFDGSGTYSSHTLHEEQESLQGQPVSEQQHRGQHSSSSNGRHSPSEAAAAALPVFDGAAADATFMKLLLLLAHKAGFVSLSCRDVQLGASLNTDFLWQLFVKVNTEQLDRELLAPFLQQSAGADSQLPEEISSLLAMRRGYGSERIINRWLVQKLDYLQVFVVKRALKALRSLMADMQQQVRSGMPSSRQSDQEKQHGHDTGAQQRLQGSDMSALDTVIAGSSNSDFGSSDQASSQVAPKLLQRPVARLQLRFRVLSHMLSAWGIIPRMDVTPLHNFDQMYPLSEPARLQPLYIEKATLPDILDPLLEPHIPSPTQALDGIAHRAEGSYDSSGRISSNGSSSDYVGVSSCSITPERSDNNGSISRSGNGSSDSGSHRHSSNSARPGLLQTFWNPVEVVEPTFRQLLVVHRKKPRLPRWRWLGGQQQAANSRQLPIQIQVYRDIPLPHWQVVFPDKLLQFRPFDLLRLDLFGLAGITAAVAQAKYTSAVLELLTLVSFTIWGTRLVLGYMRMDDRYKSIVAQLLADRTVASGEGALNYIAMSAALQQFKQAATAYVLLTAANKEMDAEQLATTAEQVLHQKLQLQVCFHAQEALDELHSFGLLQEEQQISEDSSQQNGTSKGARGGGRSSRLAAPSKARWRQWMSKAVAAVSQQSLDEPAATTSTDGVLRHSTGVLPPQQPTATVSSRAPSAKDYQVVQPAAAQQVLEQYWSGLLQSRVERILRDV